MDSLNLIIRDRLSYSSWVNSWQTFISSSKNPFQFPDLLSVVDKGIGLKIKLEAPSVKVSRSDGSHLSVDHDGLGVKESVVVDKNVGRRSESTHQHKNR